MSSVSKFLKSVDLSLILGTAATFGFYAVMAQPALKGTLLHRYTTQHPVEYVIVALFLWGLVDIVLSMLTLPREMVANRVEFLPPRTGRVPVATAAELLAGLRSRPRWQQESRLGRRIAAALDYVSQRGAGDDYRDYLTTLADKSEDEHYSRYTLIRFVIGVTPILGFLGTVVHFGTALSGISFDQLADRLTEIVAEIGQAFNTTTTALAASMSTMVILFLCERVEQNIDGAVERFTDHQLLNRFEVVHENLSPFLSILQSANEEAVRRMGSTLEKQVESWSVSLERLFERFDERQQGESASWTSALESLQQRHEALESRSDQRLAALLSQLEVRQQDHLSQIERPLTELVRLRDDVKTVGRTLQEIATGEGRLLTLQQSLADNLRLLHETQQIDAALHGLTAAIHLLTTRHRKGDAGEAKAA